MWDLSASGGTDSHAPLGAVVFGIKDLLCNSWLWTMNEILLQSQQQTPFNLQTLRLQSNSCCSRFMYRSTRRPKNNKSKLLSHKCENVVLNGFVNKRSFTGVFSWHFLLLLHHIYLTALVTSFKLFICFTHEEFIKSDALFDYFYFNTCLNCWSLLNYNSLNKYS